MASMKLPDRITVDPEIMMGKPCVKLSKADLMAVWEYAARAAAEEIILAET